MHRHTRAYAAVVIAGGYEEFGSQGRFRVGPGDVIVHGPFEAHGDRFDRRGAEILNVALAAGAPPWALGRVRDVDAIVHLAEIDALAARALLVREATPTARTAEDWPDLLAVELLADPSLRLDRWAHAHDLAPETVSRGFGRAFAMTPAAFRAEARARRALAQLVTGYQSLAATAALAGFADQAHMSRAIKSLTGATPGSWHGSSSFKTGAAASD